MLGSAWSFSQNKVTIKTLKNLLAQLSFESKIICLTETWCQPDSNNNNLYKFPHYTSINQEDMEEQLVYACPFRNPWFLSFAHILLSYFEWWKHRSIKCQKNLQKSKNYHSQIGNLLLRSRNMRNNFKCFSKKWKKYISQFIFRLILISTFYIKVAQKWIPT